MTSNGFQGGIAGGDVNPYRFAMQDTAKDFGVLQATANAVTLGVTLPGSRVFPQPGGSTLSAAAGESVGVAGPGQVAKLQIGAAVTRGQRLIADAQGRGVPAATTGTTVQEVGARALFSSAVVGAIVDVLVEQYPHRPALS
jgi:hypothetical protein